MRYCSKCGHNVNEDASFCSNCGNEIPVFTDASKKTEGENNTPWYKKRWKATVVILLTILLAILFNNMLFPRSDIEMGATQLYDDYLMLGNEAGDAKYKEKTITVSGVIVKISQFANSPDFYVELNTPGSRHVIFGFENIKTIKQLKAGDLVKIQGLCIGMFTYENKSPYIGFTNSKILQ